MPMHTRGAGNACCGKAVVEEPFADERRLLGNSWVRKELIQGQPDGELLLHAKQRFDRGQRVSPEPEEVVAGSHRRAFQDIAPRQGHQLFDDGARRLEANRQSLATILGVKGSRGGIDRMHQVLVFLRHAQPLHLPRGSLRKLVYDVNLPSGF